MRPENLYHSGISSMTSTTPSNASPRWRVTSGPTSSRSIKSP